MSFSQALSGINAQREKLGAIGNNIANSQTVGFKSSDVQFADVFAQSRIGLGTKVSTTLQNFNQGNIESSGRNMDLAIAGEGFFRFQQPGGEVGYSRNGQLTMTADGDLVNAQGAQIMGYPADADGNVQVGGDVVPLNIDAVDLQANTTTSVETSLNLDSRVEAGKELQQAEVVTDMQNQNNPMGKESFDYHYSTNFTTYDSLGNARNISVYYEKRPEAENSWLGRVTMDGYYDMKADPVGKATGEVVEGAKESRGVAVEAYGDLLAGMTNVQDNLQELKSVIDSAAASAESAGKDKAGVISAVESAAQSFASGAGFDLSEVLDKYLNGQTITPAENSVYAAYVDKVKGEMDTAGDAGTAVANAQGVSPLSDGDTVAEFDKYVTASQSSIVGGVPSDFAAVAQAATDVIVTNRTAGNNIDAQISTSQGTTLNTEAAVIDAVNDVVNAVSQDVLQGVIDQAVIDKVNDVKDAANAATGTNISAVVDAAEDADPGEAFESYGTNDFVLEFNKNGTLKRVGEPQLADGGGVEYVDSPNNRPSITFASNNETPLGGATEPLDFDINFSGTTQFGNNAVVNDISQDGYTSGSLVGTTIEDDGTVMRNYSNEQSRAAGQVSLVSFRNPEGLKPEGDNLWSATGASGQELVGAPGTGQRGLIEPGAVETSNVDLAQELVEMIVSQRAYQANSQTISTQDELLQTIINL